MKKTTALIPLSLIALTLAACTSPGENTKRNAAMGAGVGAVAGGLIGSDDGDAASGALTGAAVGAAAGGAYGNVQDAREEDQARERAAAEERDRTVRRDSDEYPVTDYDRDGIVDTQDDFVDVDGDGINDKEELEKNGYRYDGD